jgi:hypothetical protein
LHWLGRHPHFAVIEQIVNRMIEDQQLTLILPDQLPFPVFRGFADLATKAHGILDESLVEVGRGHFGAHAKNDNTIAQGVNRESLGLPKSSRIQSAPLMNQNTLQTRLFAGCVSQTKS